MSVESERVKHIERRWLDEGKISSRDVAWLIGQAKAAETMRAANGLRDASRTPSERLIDGLFSPRFGQ